MLYCTDPKVKDPSKSVSLTLIWITFYAGLIKFLIGGFVIFGHLMPLFSPSDFGILMTPFLSLYFLRKGTDIFIANNKEKINVDQNGN